MINKLLSEIDGIKGLLAALRSHEVVSALVERNIH